MSRGRALDADWLEFDDARRFYVGVDGMRHIPAGLNARCGVGSLAVVLRPEEEIEFRCSNCWPSKHGASEAETLAADPRIVIPGETELWEKVAELLYADVESDTPPGAENSQAGPQ